MKSKELKLIERIHNEFDTAEERLLKQANDILAKPIDQHETVVEAVGKRLIDVGFKNTPVAKKAMGLFSEKAEKEKVMVETREQAELIQYYQRTYPFLKFLTEQELDRICGKYNLMHAPVDRYTKDVPEKNLRDIENARPLHEVDATPKLIKLTARGFNEERLMELMRAMGKSDAVFTQDEINTTFAQYYNFKVPKWTDNAMENTWLYVIWKALGRPGFYDYTGTEITQRDGLFICAPETHFDTTGLTKKGLGFFEVFKTEVKDPIVFRYVRGGVQVLTKWGLEAEDPGLLLPINN